MGNNTKLNADDFKFGVDADVIYAALERLPDDPGALFEGDVIPALRHLQAQNAPEFARVRKRIKDINVIRMGDLDKLLATSTGAVTNQGTAVSFLRTVAFHEEVEGDVLISDLCAHLKRYVVADEDTLFVASFWIIMTWCMDVMKVAPIAHITAPEKRCGKTRLLDAFNRLCFHPLMTSNASIAALYRVIEEFRPTLLVDEVDTFLKHNEEARGIINAGFEPGSPVYRCVGDESKATQFDVFCAKALCGIGSLADTIEDRTIPLRLRRKYEHEKVENPRKTDPEKWELLKSQIARFVEDNIDIIGSASPNEIHGINDRANDCMEPLMMIASVMPYAYTERLTNVARDIFSSDHAVASVSVELLRDVREIFSVNGADRLFTEHMISSLVLLPDAPWATINRGKQVNGNYLAKRFKAFGIKPGTIRIGDVTQKGYQRGQFEEAFERYLPGTTIGEVAVTPSQSEGEETRVERTVSPDNSSVTERGFTEPKENSHCDGVTAKNGLSFL